jgi:hypothetical protein
MKKGDAFAEEKLRFKIWSKEKLESNFYHRARTFDF